MFHAIGHRRFVARSGLVALALLLAAACSRPATNATEPAPDPAPSDPTAPPTAGHAAAAPETGVAMECDELCTEIAVCWEQVNGGDYSGGGMCVSGCDELDDTAKQAFATCVGEAKNCGEMLACE